MCSGGACSGTLDVDETPADLKTKISAARVVYPHEVAFPSCDVGALGLSAGWTQVTVSAQPEGYCLVTANYADHQADGKIADCDLVAVAESMGGCSTAAFVASLAPTGTDALVKACQ